MSTISNRLQKVLDEKGMIAADIANELGVSRASVSAWLSGSSKEIKSQYLFPLARLLGVNAEWLATGNAGTNMNTSESRQAVPLFEMKDNALHSAVATFDALALLKIMYPAQALAPSVDLLGIICNSDTMKPTINNGEVMLCDRSVRQFAGDGIYIIRNNVLFVRRLSLGTDNTVSAYAENRQYDTITQPLSAMDIVARVIGVFLYTPMG